MEIQGKIMQIMPERTGENSRGKWTAQEYVLETTTERYPKNILFGVFGKERIDRFNLRLGGEYIVKFDIDAHEYQGKWYNQLTAYEVSAVGGAPAQHTQQLPDEPPF